MSETLETWIPLECNPEVFNGWAEKAGLVTSQDEFQDVYGLDPELLAFIPKPVKAVIVLFPVSPDLRKIRNEEDASLQSGALPAVDPTVIWIKQTIANACGTMGLLHALINSPVTMVPESPLEKFIDLCKGKSPLERARLLETTNLFTDIHSEAAHSGQSAIPAFLHTPFHYTCFVKAPSVVEGHPTSAAGNRLVELEGGRVGPIDRGPCGDDLLHAVAKFVQETYIPGSGSVNFSMMALAPPQD